MLKRIHVNQHAIKRNAKKAAHREKLDRLKMWAEAEMVPDDEPPITVKTYKSNEKCFEVEINGPSKVIYSPDKPLSCGARLWIETDAEVVTK